VNWFPFDLHPEYPEEGLPRERLLTRYGEGGIGRVSSMFEAYDLVYNPNPDVVPNTMKALRLTELARDLDLHRHMHDRLMQAYWEEAQDIGDADVLRRLATEAGLDAAEVDEVLGGDAFRERVLASTAEAQALGVNGIPAFVLDDRLLLLGAQPHEVFEQAFARLEAA
jgi:predicted DsbA family dithiol-disulfide isomerase